MAYLRYYEKERERHPALQTAGCAFEDARAVLIVLADEHGIELEAIERTSGVRQSHFHPDTWTIRLNTDFLNWRTVIHEFAHALDYKRHKIWGKRFRWHTSRHAEIVDDLAKVVVSRGWIVSIPAERLVKIEMERARAADANDPKIIRAKKIEKRKIQIARLDRALRQCWIREKAVTTRLVKAKRSLVALERAAQDNP